MSKEKKPKKIIFSEEVDSAINGYALGVSFLGIGVFLLAKPDYFFSPIVSYILGAIIGIFGVCGAGVELSKSSKIKGMDNLAYGLAFSVAWLIAYLKISTLWANIVFFFFLVFGTYSICLGLIQGIYSIINNTKLKGTNDKKIHSKGNIISQIILFMTQISGLIIAICNVIKAVNV